PRPTPFILLLILTAALLTLGPEYVYLKDQFGQRINTVFKFWYQAWLLFGIAAAVGLNLLYKKSHLVGTLTLLAYTLLLGGSLLFPFYMLQWGQLWYGNAPTLNGVAISETQHPDEFAAISWLAAHANPTAVVLEATGGQYSDYARVSMRTGLPTLLGWAGHEYQWRGETDEPGERTTAITQIYSQRDWQGIAELLDRYAVDYVYVGRLEREAYGEDGLTKFAENMEVAYQNDTAVIYKWK
ncbi:MAG TPA: hypothetical protein ENJ56_05510, partial [Anaerolineae bacterium]|nr:hypothetical protein [Anaerolineae bacterium]